MKRKVKFQEGGEVPSMTAAERRRANIERLNARRAVEDFNRREQAGQLDERTMRRAGGTPVTSEVADFNRRLQSGQMDAETMRRMGGTPSGPADFDVNSRGEARAMSRSRDLATRSGGRVAFSPEGRLMLNPPQGSAEALRSGAGMTPRAGGSALSLRGPSLAGAGLAAAAILPQLYDALRNRPRSQDDLDVMEAYRTGRDVREIRAAREAAAQPVQPAVTPDQMQAADVPGNRATSGAGAPAAARMREIDMQGGDVPGNVAMNPQARPQPTRRAAAPARRESVTADDLNAMVLRLQGGAAPQTETERRLADRMGIAYRKGGMVAPKKYQEGGPVKVPGKYTRMGGAKAPAPRMRDMVSPEERKELDAPLTQAEKNRLRGDNFKKGGKVMTKKMKTGGKVPAPKKMMKGGITSKPKVKPKMYAKGGMTKGCK